MDFIKKLFGRGGKEGGSSTEGPRHISIQFWDLREETAAKERGVPAGLYFTANPILESDLNRPTLIPEMSFSFFEKLGQEGLMESSNVQIAVDTKQKMVVDPQDLGLHTFWLHTRNATSAHTRESS